MQNRCISMKKNTVILCGIVFFASIAACIGLLFGLHTVSQRERNYKDLYFQKIYQETVRAYRRSDYTLDARKEVKENRLPNVDPANAEKVKEAYHKELNAYGAKIDKRTMTKADEEKFYDFARLMYKQYALSRSHMKTEKTRVNELAEAAMQNLDQYDLNAEEKNTLCDQLQQNIGASDNAWRCGQYSECSRILKETQHLIDGLKEKA